MENNDGGPAFPVYKYVNSDGLTFTSEPTGMSLRDWFAGMALPAIINRGKHHSFDEAVASAYEYANTMIKERSYKEIPYEK